MTAAMPGVIAQLPENPEFLDVLQFQLTGLVVVFGALAVIWVLLEIIGALFRLQRAKSAPPTTAPTFPADLDSGVVAAIATAVHFTMDGQPHRISSVTAAQDHANGSPKIASSASSPTASTVSPS